MGKMRQFRREIRDSVGKPLLFYTGHGYGFALRGLFERIVRTSLGERIHDAEIHEVMADTRSEIEEEGEPKRISIAAGPQLIPGGPGGKATALVPVRGVALYDLEFQPYCFSTLLLAQTVTALANDPEVGTIVLDIDSPGGVVTGTAEAGDAIFAARKRKKVVALVNPLAASAAYWLASQATEIIAIKSADIGSIGVFMVHNDCSEFNKMQGLVVSYIYAGEFKVEGNPDAPLSGEARAYYQSEVDTIYQQFLKAVARGRGISVKEVFDTFGKGRCMMAPAAKAVGMIDDFMSLSDAMARFGASNTPKQDARRRGEDDAPEPSAEEVQPSPIIFHKRDGKVYAAKPWPACTEIDVEAFQDSENVNVTVGDEHVKINVDNGAAVYRRTRGHGRHGYWFCELQEGSTYEPMPAVTDPVENTAPVDVVFENCTIEPLTVDPESDFAKAAKAESEAADAAAAIREAEIDAAFIRSSALRA